MKVTEKKNEGLKREYEITVTADAVTKEIDNKLSQLAQTVKMAGFRPGKVPLKLIKQKHGKAVLSEVTQDLVSKTTTDVLKDKDVTPALQPKIKISDDFDEGKDLSFNVSLEVYPEVPEVDFGKISLEKSVVDVAEEDIADGLKRLCEAKKEFKPLESPHVAEKGHSVSIDFEGSVDGELFAGGAAEKFKLELGSGQFIPGFEDQLIGVKAGDEKVVDVTFPEDYNSKDLAGKQAQFKVKVHEVLEATLPEANDEFAKNIGFEDLKTLKEEIEKQIKEDFERICETKIKKELFDALSEQYEFDVPEGMFDIEYEALLNDAGLNKESTEKEDKEKQEEFKQLSLRRVRLGILLAQIGKDNNVQITQDEIRDAVFSQARAYPGQEKQVLEYFQNNPQAVEQLKGPILEEKSFKIILEKVAVKEKKATVKELLAFEES